MVQILQENLHGINCKESLYSRRMESSQAVNETHDIDTVMHGVETLLKEMRDSRQDNRVYENMPNTKKTKVMPLITLMVNHLGQNISYTLKLLLNSMVGIHMKEYNIFL